MENARVTIKLTKEEVARDLSRGRSVIIGVNRNGHTFFKGETISAKFPSGEETHTLEILSEPISSDDKPYILVEVRKLI